MRAAQRTRPALQDSQGPAPLSCLCLPPPGQQLSAPSSRSSHKVCSSRPWVVGMLPGSSSSSRQPLQHGSGRLQMVCLRPQQIPALLTPA